MIKPLHVILITVYAMIMQIQGYYRFEYDSVILDFLLCSCLSIECIVIIVMVYRINQHKSV